MVPIIGCIDSFVIAAAMAVSGCPRAYQHKAVLGFAAFDFLASWLAFPFTTQHAWIVLIASALSFVLIYAAKRWPTLFLLVPVLCCLDNFFGASGGRFQLGSAAAEAVASGAMAWMGCSMGSLLRDRSKGGIA
jgi:hypothetical protein